jgi:hypothetical protein
MLEAAQFFFRLRAVGQRTGLITNWGAGTFGFMRSVALMGPLTVPQIAQMRPTSASGCSAWRTNLPPMGSWSSSAIRATGARSWYA